jgi:hypothetical protein
MAIGMKSISNYDYLRYMIAASREISDEPYYYSRQLKTRGLPTPLPRI